MIQRLLLLIAALAASAVAGAAERSWDVVELGLSGYLTSNGSDLRLDSELGGLGSELDLEDTLNLEDDLTELRVDLQVRFLPSHRVTLTYYDISRDGESVTRETLRIGDSEFDVGITLQTDLQYQVFKVAYAWSIVHNDRTDVAISLGAHAMDVDFRATGQLLGSQEIRTESADEVFPLPVVGVHLAQRLTERLTLSLHGEYFGIEISDVDGDLFDVSAMLDWKLTDNLGVSIGYNYVNFDLDSQNSEFPGSVNYDYSALVAGLKVFF